jgi:hypothetical protein
VPIPPAQYKDDREWGDNEQKDEPPLRSTNEDLDDDIAVQKAIKRSITEGRRKGPLTHGTLEGRHQGSSEKETLQIVRRILESLIRSKV